jgi:hypothetical protein
MTPKHKAMVILFTDYALWASLGFLFGYFVL